MRIGDLSAATGASPRSLRYYEQQGLMASQRSPSGQRLYADATIERVRLIRNLLGAGLSSDTIREVLPCVADESIRTPWLAERLEAEQSRIEEQMACLSATRDALGAVIERYRVEGSPAEDSAADREVTPAR
ncbi:MerR family transcriptional regulator [Luteipulveratus mongoliensis]|uniref:MerR family transcriptional regulator n=1 Tax=Luteipulveratus mongoliensis TaxID=571913 RepID=A0A0K1JFI0_9MICO|nr:MerR family transcriptional regulator [Luteipulveratus mongoliensis]AKU15350.1 MerR family transcriptional regulator [Luteipulveratus mongoliensis]